ncbi:Crp/Fnr family transcriptional regulator [Aurantibacter sp.]|uniref:Crp/Fnr family transcriptional regulator n=1 Tax=Aurantibacter sp. TaxID=2807103 RepID=UPI0032640FB7
MSDTIRSIIATVAPISTKSFHKLNDLIKYVHFDQGELITSVGQQNNLEYFLINGICKTFLYTPEGEDVTISFFMPNSIISPSTTRNKDGKSLINLCALTAVEVAAIDAEAFEKLMVEDLEIRHFGNTVLRNELMTKVQKEIALASLKGIDRLLLLRKNYPNIENRIPHADIASYLGLTTISLSRLRTKS